MNDEKVLLKIIVLGASNVGKTSLMKRYTTDSFSEVRRATIGADFMTKKSNIDGIEITLQVNCTYHYLCKKCFLYILLYKY